MRTPALATSRQADLKRGDVVERPNQLRVGDTLVVVDRERLLSGLSSVMARIAIEEHHDTTLGRLRRAGISKAGPSDPSHFHGILTLFDPPEWDDGEPTSPSRVNISTESPDIHVVHHGTNNHADLPRNPLYILELRTEVAE